MYISKNSFEASTRTVCVKSAKLRIFPIFSCVYNYFPKAVSMHIYKFAAYMNLFVRWFFSRQNKAHRNVLLSIFPYDWPWRVGLANNLVKATWIWTNFSSALPVKKDVGNEHSLELLLATLGIRLYVPLRRLRYHMNERSTGKIPSLQLFLEQFASMQEKLFLY